MNAEVRPMLLKKSISRTLAKFSVLMEIYYAITFRFLRDD
jgi:hypothetical protein